MKNVGDKCIVLGCKNKAQKQSQRLCKKHFKEFVEDVSPVKRDEREEVKRRKSVKK